MLTNNTFLILFIVLIFYFLTKKTQEHKNENYTNVDDSNNSSIQATVNVNNQILPSLIPNDILFNNRDYYEKNSEERLSKLIFG